MCNPSTNQVPLNVRASLESNIRLGLRNPTGPLWGVGVGWGRGAKLEGSCPVSASPPVLIYM